MLNVTLKHLPWMFVGKMLWNMEPALQASMYNTIYNNNEFSID